MFFIIYGIILQVRKSTRWYWKLSVWAIFSHMFVIVMIYPLLVKIDTLILWLKVGHDNYTVQAIIFCQDNRNFLLQIFCYEWNEMVNWCVLVSFSSSLTLILFRRQRKITGPTNIILLSLIIIHEICYSIALLT